MNVKKIMNKKDYHIVADGVQGRMKCYDYDGNLKWIIPCLCKGVMGPGSDVQGGDTPPGTYLVGQLTETQSDEPASTWNAFGKFFFDLVELENQEASRGRAGVGVHGGGSASPNPLAENQGLYPTHGCVRLLNKDLRDKFLNTYRYAKKNGGKLYLTVLQ